jgi:hypothetical protein
LVFAASVAADFSPTFELLENVKFRYSVRAISLIEDDGAKVMHIPAYSPGFNPIEECSSKIKQMLRSLKARTKRKL